MFCSIFRFSFDFSSQISNVTCLTSTIRYTFWFASMFPFQNNKYSWPVGCMCALHTESSPCSLFSIVQWHFKCVMECPINNSLSWSLSQIRALLSSSLASPFSSCRACEHFYFCLCIYFACKRSKPQLPNLFHLTITTFFPFSLYSLSFRILWQILIWTQQLIFANVKRTRTHNTHKRSSVKNQIDFKSMTERSRGDSEFCVTL